MDVAPMLGRMARRVLESFGEEPERLSKHIVVADREIDLRLSISEDSDEKIARVMAVTVEWGFTVELRQSWHQTIGAPAVGEQVMHEARFQGSWKRFERDAILLSLVLGDFGREA